MENTLKTCATCKTDKQLSDFGPDKKTKDGKNYNCKACCAVYLRKQRAKKKQDVIVAFDYYE